jgi:lysophospholipase L1-like esterase
MSSYEYYEVRKSGSTARTVCAVFGFLTGAATALVAWLTEGEAAAIAVAAVILVIALYGAIGAPRELSFLIAFALILGFAGSTYFIGNQALSIYRAINETAGPVDPADPALLAEANSKFDEAAAEAGFHIELHETEISSYVLNGLGEIENNPVRRVDIDVIDGVAGAPGTIALSGEFKSGGVDFRGTIGVILNAGAVQVDVINLELGALELPGIGKSAIEDLLAEVTDLNATLTDLRADVQSIEIGNDRIVVTGTQPEGNLLTSDALLSGIAAQAASVGTAVEPPPEPLPPGIINGVSAPGDRYYLALGDSLAANVGVGEASLGYVSRVHRQLQLATGIEYGLRNFGVSGETSGTLIRSGQLDTALAFIAGEQVDYLTIDIGANDLLGHLGSADCAADLDAPACQTRIQATFLTYEANMAAILDVLRAAAPATTIVFIRAYNPFSLGLGGGIAFEQRSDEILDGFNDVAARLALERGMLVADGFSALQGTTAATTHMLDPQPDIHPYGIGYSLIAQAVVDAVASSQ